MYKLTLLAGVCLGILLGCTCCLALLRVPAWLRAHALAHASLPYAARMLSCARMLPCTPPWALRCALRPIGKPPLLSERC